jgi:protein-S-isoprenylcysteine O-methyltransferase Ste14
MVVACTADGIPPMRRFPDVPPVWALGAAMLAWLFARALPVAPLPAGLGWLFGAAGLGVVLWAALWFWRKGTPIDPHGTPRALIVEGPYRLNRNPIYTGLLFIVLGWALWLGALSAVVPAIGLFIVLDRRFVRPEEAGLRAAFGPAAEAYFRSTRRW